MDFFAKIEMIDFAKYFVVITAGPANDMAPFKLF